MRKRLLKENTTRRFMKLADIGSLTENFIDGTVYEQDEEEELPAEEPGLEEPGLEEPGLEEPGLEEPGMEEPGMEEPGMDAGGEEATLDLSAEETEELLAAIGEKVGELTGHDISTSLEGAEEAEAGLEEPMPGEEEEAALEPAPDLAPPEGEVPEEEPEEEELEEADVFLEDDPVNEEDLVNEITRRVARRLVGLSKK